MPLVFLALAALIALAVLVVPSAVPHAGQLMTLRMLQQMALLFAVPPVALVGIRKLGLHMPGGCLGKAVAASTHPAAAMANFNLVAFLWYLPPVYEAAGRSGGLSAVMYASWLVGISGFWWVVIEPLRADRPQRDTIVKIGYLVVAGVPPTVPGILLALAPGPIYPSYPLIEDQQLAGLVMFGSAKAVLLLSLALLFGGLLRGPEGGDDWDRERERRAPGPAGLPPWVRRLQEPEPLPDEPPHRLPVRFSSTSARSHPGR